MLCLLEQCAATASLNLVFDSSPNMPDIYRLGIFALDRRSERATATITLTYVKVIVARATSSLSIVPPGDKLGRSSTHRIARAVLLDRSRDDCGSSPCVGADDIRCAAVKLSLHSQADLSICIFAQAIAAISTI